MVVSRDWQEISVLECILSSLHMDVSVETEPERAWERLNHSKIDALIIDCDLAGNSALFEKLKAGQRHFNTVPLVIMGGPQCMATIDETGALFAFKKPISVEQAVRTLSAARSMILEGRLRYHRIGVEVPVSLKTSDAASAKAHLVNVSQGGMRIHSDQPIDTGAVQIRCELPGFETDLKAEAEVVWHDQSGNVGIRFVNLPEQQQKALHIWVAQKFITN